MKKSNFIEGAVIASLAIILTKVIGVLYVIPFYAIIGSQGGALYGYAYNIYNVFLIMSTAGIPLAISKITSEYNSLNKLKEKQYLFKFANKFIKWFSLTSFLICFIGAKFLAKLIIGDVSGGNTIEDITFVIRCVSFALLIVPTLSITRGYLQGHKFIAASSLSQVIEQFMRVLVILGGSLLVLKVFNLSVTTAVGISVFGAFIGALSAYFYLTNKSKKIDKYNEQDDLSQKAKNDVKKKILSYCLPFIIITISGSIYNSTDMILLIRGLNHIGMKATDIETISSIFTTWGNKMVSIVTAIGTGIIISLIPSLVSAYVKNDKKTVNKEFNKALQILFFVILPISLFVSIFAREIWIIFYGNSYYGPIVMKYLFIVAFFDASFTMTCSALQGLNKKKLIYTSVALGLGLNALLDIPLIYLFNFMNWPPYYGAITATLIGYVTSLIVVLSSLHKNDGLSYKETFSKLPKHIFKTIIILIGCFVLSIVIKPINNRLILLIIMGGIGLCFIISYYFWNKKNMEDLLGKNLLKRLIKR